MQILLVRHGNGRHQEPHNLNIFDAELTDQGAMQAR